MLAEVQTQATLAQPKVTLRHNGESREFNVSIFKRASFTNDFDVFDYLNQYWAQLPRETQGKIWDIYVEVDEIFNDVSIAKNEMFALLTEKVRELLDLHTLDRINAWLWLSDSPPKVPATCPVEYQFSMDNNNTAEKTYTRNDFVQLANMVVALKSLIPILGEYIACERAELGTRHKEYRAFHMTSSSWLPDCEPMNKLMTYAMSVVGKDAFDHRSVLENLSSEDYPHWLVANICVLKLVVGDLRGGEGRTDIVRLVYSFILQKLRGTDSNFSEHVKPKRPLDRNETSDSNLSVIDVYKIKADITLEDMIGLTQGIVNPFTVARKLSSLVTEEEVSKSIATSSVLEKFRIVRPQFNLLSWVFGDVIGPKCLEYVDEGVIYHSSMGVLEAVLAARGFPYLAVLSTAYRVDGVGGHAVTSNGFNPRFSKEPELEAKIAKYYPLKRTVNAGKSDEKVVNLVIEDINLTAKAFSSLSLRATARDELLERAVGSTNRRLQIKSDLRAELCRLVLEIGSKSWI